MKRREAQILPRRARRVHSFASPIEYSRFAQASLVPDERVEALVRTLVADLPERCPPAGP